ncbi:MAG: translocation/assembly module TamB domain-containing protein [Acidobacteria bacterium]|nr:translocation/assembly module TamB domain-containing protein [Acidobacteriota bacterium]
MQDVQRPRSKRPRWLRLLALALLLPVVLLAALYAFRGLVLRTAGVPLAEWLAARFAGYEVQVDRLRGDPLHWVEVEGLDARPKTSKGESPKGISFTADRLRLDFSLARLRSAGLDGVGRISGSGLEIRGDLGESDGPSDAPWPAAPGALPPTDLEAVTVDLGLGGGTRLQIDGAELHVEPQEAAGQAITLSSPRLALELPGETPPAAPVDLALTYADASARFDRLTWGDLRLEPGARLDLTSLPARRLDWQAAVTLPAGTVTTEGRYDPDGLGIDFETGTGEEGSATAGAAAGLELGRMPAWVLPPEVPALSGRVAGRGRLDLPSAPDGDLHVDFDGSVDGLRVDERSFGRVTVRGAVDGAVIRAERLEALSPGNRVLLTDAVLDLQAPDWDGRLAASHGAVEASISDLPALLGATAGDLLDPKTGRLLDRAPQHRLELSAHLEDATIHLERGHLETPGGHLDLEPSSVRFIPGEAPQLEVAASADFTDLEPLGRVLASQPWSGSLKVDLEAKGRWPNLSGSLDATGETVVAAGYRLGTVDARATGDGRRLDFDRFALAGPWGILEATGGVVLAERRLDGVRLEANVTDASALSPSLPITGTLTATAELDGPPTGLEGRVALSGDGRYGDFWTLENLVVDAVAEPGFLRLERLDVATPVAHLSATGSVADPFTERPEAILEQLTLEGDGKDLVLQQPARLALEAAGLAVDDIDLRGTAGTVVADLTHREGVTRWRARLDDLDPTPFAGPYLPAGLALSGITGTVEGSLAGNTLEATSTGSVAHLTLPSVGRELAASWQGSLAGGRLSLDRLEATSGGRPLLDLRGEAPFDPLGPDLLAAGPVKIQGKLSAPTIDELPIELESSTITLSGQLGAQLDLEGSWRSLQGEARLEGEDVEVVLPRDGGTETLGPGSLEGHVQIGDGLELDSLSVELPDRATFRATGRWKIPTGVTPYLEAADTAALIGGAGLRLDVDADAADMTWVSRWLPGVRRLGGRAKAQLSLAGTLDEPEVDGWAELDDGDLRLDSDVASIDDLEGRLRLTPERIEVERLSGQLGAAPIRVTGTVGLEGESPALDLAISGENVLLVRNDELRMRADLDLRLDGTLAAPRAHGDIGLRNSRVYYRVNFTELVSGGSGPASSGGLQLFSFSDPPLSDMALDVRVRTVDPISISSNVAKGGARVDLQLGGTGEVPLPRGAIFLEPTKVRLPSGVVDFNSGTVSFQSSSPFDPDLALSGEARLRGYDVTLQVTGSLAEPEVLLSSTPPLSNDQLLLLVLTGQAPSSGQPGVTTAGSTDTATAAAQSVALYLARDVLSRWTGQGWDENDESFLDRLDLVVGREVSESGSLTTEAAYLLREDFPHQDDDLYLVAERDAYDAYNYGLRLVFRFK